MPRFVLTLAQPTATANLFRPLMHFEVPEGGAFDRLYEENIFRGDFKRDAIALVAPQDELELRDDADQPLLPISRQMVVEAFRESGAPGPVMSVLDHVLEQRESDAEMHALIFILRAVEE